MRRPDGQRGLEQPEAPAARRRRRARWRAARPAGGRTWTTDAIARRARRGSARPTPSATGSCTAATRVRRRRRAIDDAVRAEPARRSSDLAPLHQPPRSQALDAVGDARCPDVPAVACFDTAFHATLPPPRRPTRVPARVAGALGAAPLRLPRPLARLRGRRAAELLGGRRRRRVVVCHLGAGASLARSGTAARVDTTMGFTPLEGLVMATRSGIVDPGAGAVAGGARRPRPADGRARRWSTSRGCWRSRAPPTCARCSSAPAAGDADAVLARRRLPAPAACRRSPRWRRRSADSTSLVFTGGVGEHAPTVREAAVEGLSFLGLGVEADANARAENDADISSADARVRTLVIHAREDLEMARQAESVLG